MDRRALLIFLALLALAFGGYFFYSNYSSQQEKKAQATEQGGNQIAEPVPDSTSRDTTDSPATE